jgi:hypothetical protein
MHLKGLVHPLIVRCLSSWVPGYGEPRRSILQAVNRPAQKVVNIRSEAREAYQRYRAIKTLNRR